MSANDGRRFRVFAEFIGDTYPGIATIADVAGGRGDLSFRLHELGYGSTVIDVREAQLRHRIRRALRKQSVKEGRLIEIQRIIGKIQDVDLRAFDLIVALHPDQATEHAIRAAIALGKDFAIVPCCVFPIDGIRRSEETWLRYLGSLSSDIFSARLPIDGANTVLYRRTNTVQSSRETVSRSFGR